VDLAPPFLKGGFGSTFSKGGKGGNLMSHTTSHAAAVAATSGHTASFRHHLHHLHHLHHPHFIIYPKILFFKNWNFIFF